MTEKKQTGTCSVGKAQDMLLWEIYRHRLLTPMQVTRLLYKESMVTVVRSRLRSLAEAGYLLRLELPSRYIGQKPILYALARKGMNYLEDQGADVRSRYRPVEERELSHAYMLHTLALNDVIIAVRLLPHHVPELRIARWYHEQELKHMPLTTTVRHSPDGQMTKEITMHVEPDAWVDLRLARPEQQERQYCFWIELDRGTEGAKQCKRRIRAMVEVIKNGAYNTAFNSRSAMILFATTAGEDRVRHMREYAREVLKDEDTIITNMVLFRALPMDSTNTDRVGVLDPSQLFCSLAWKTAFSKDMVAALRV